MKFVLVLALASAALVLTDVSSAADKGDDIVGDWLTANGEAKIHFAKEGSSYVGRVAWLKTPNGKDGKPVTDVNNPDPTLRARTMMGSALVWSLKYDGSDSYTDGYCYDPVGGKTYKGKATLESTNRLALRGYIGIPLFGRSESWSRTN